MSSAFVCGCPEAENVPELLALSTTARARYTTRNTLPCHRAGQSTKASVPRASTVSNAYSVATAELCSYPPPRCCKVPEVAPPCPGDRESQPRGNNVSETLSGWLAR